MAKAFLIALEGIDGAGKRTQTQLLVDRARQAGLTTATLSFPRYGQTLFSKAIASYLNGEFGGLKDVPAQLVSLLYAGDRLESLAEINRLRDTNDVLVFDRYVSSNLAYQAAKVPPEQRGALMDWIFHVEHDVYSLPRPDLNLFLDLAPETSARLMAQRGARAYTEKTNDLHEADRLYLEACRGVYHALAGSEQYGLWKVVRSDRDDTQMRPPEEIGQQLWKFVEEVRRGRRDQG